MEAASVAHEHHGPPEANRSSRVEPQLLGMLLFIISEIMIFAAFFTAYFFIRVVVTNAQWPGVGFHIPVDIAGVNTAILLTSSVTVTIAHHALREGKRGVLTGFLAATFLLGFLFVAAVVLIGALLAFRMVPAYIEWYTVQRALDAAVKDATDPTLNNIRRSMERKLNADYADAVSARDVEVTRTGNTITASVSWQKKLPLVSNVSLLLDFDATSSR